VPIFSFELFSEGLLQLLVRRPCSRFLSVGLSQVPGAAYSKVQLLRTVFFAFCLGSLVLEVGVIRGIR
jgi:hypothetical protein